MKKLLFRVLVYGWVGLVFMLGMVLFSAMDLEIQLLNIAAEISEAQADLFMVEAEIILDLKKAGIDLDQRPTQSIPAFNNA